MKETHRVDVAIIGVGTAGQSAAREVSKVTDDFIVIDDRLRGTTCAYAGCMPSKVLIQMAEDFHRSRSLKGQGVRGAAELELDPAVVMARVREMRDAFVSGSASGMTKLGRHLIQGTARFLGPQHLEVKTEKSEENEQSEDSEDSVHHIHHIHPNKTIIATGSNPMVPEPWKALSPYVLTTEDLFEVATLPKSLAVIGLGPVGLELGQALARLDVEVHGFDLASTVGNLSDPAVASSAQREIQKDLAIHLNTKVDLTENPDGPGLLVKAFPQEQTNQGDAHRGDAQQGDDQQGDAQQGDDQQGDAQQSASPFEVPVDAALVTVGRPSNLEPLTLENAGVLLKEGGRPEVDPTTCRIQDLPIYLAGDASGRRAVLHEASDEGRIAGYNAARSSDYCFSRRVPLSILFTDPNIVHVGRSFKRLLEPDKPVSVHTLDDREVVVGEMDFAHQSRAKILGRAHGLIHVYASKKTGKLLGAQLAVPHGEHLGHLLAWAIQNDLTVFDLLSQVYYHPTVEEGLRRALRHAAKQTAVSAPSHELALCDSCSCV